MRENEFREWMLDEEKCNVRPAADAKSRCRRVEKVLTTYCVRSIDLDKEYTANRCFYILNLLEYENRAALVQTTLPQDKAGLSSLRSAVKKYIDFCDKHKP